MVGIVFCCFSLEEKEEKMIVFLFRRFGFLVWNLHGIGELEKFILELISVCDFLMK